MSTGSVASTMRPLSLLRTKAEDSGGAALGARVDPELDYLKLKYKAEVEEAIMGALAQLSARDCALLRRRLGERMRIDALGSVYSMNRATAARWLAAAQCPRGEDERDSASGAARHCMSESLQLLRRARATRVARATCTSRPWPSAA
jgi:hypothetical protein